MKGRELAGRCCFLLTLFCVILNAASGDPPWAVSAIRDTGLPRANQNLAAMSANGDLYSTTGRLELPRSCTSPTLIAGDANTFSSCVTKVDATGRQVFAVEIGGGAVTALVVGATGDAYIAGEAGPTGAGFPATAGVYEKNPPGAPDPFVCRLSGNDGHPLYCTFIDVSPDTNGFLAVDASGSAYTAGICAGNFHTICVEKLNPLGTALVYKANVFTDLLSLRGVAAVDGPGNLFVAQQDAGIAKVGPTGALEGTSGPLNGIPVALVLDSSGAPELVLQDNVVPGVLRLRRWTPDLAAVLFDKELLTGALFTGSTLNIGIDSSGTTTIVGASYGANLATLHPTQPCNAATAAGSAQPAAGYSAFLARFDANGALLQSTYLGIPPGFVNGALILFGGGDASVVYSPESPFIASGNWEIVNLGPASSEIGLSCIGDGAAFTNAALSPNEIVSVFGNGIGPAQPVTAQPDPAGIYLSQLGGTQVTFDGQPAPILYAASGQINVVTPGSLQAKTTTHVCVRVANTSTNCLDFGVRPMAPYIFLSARPYAAALNQDGTINSATNPAPAGSVVSIFGTGFGAVGNSIPDGGITPPAAAQYPGLQMEATWQISVFNETTSPVTVQYAGAAPLEVEGVGQINFVVPATSAYPFPVLSGPTFAFTITSKYDKFFSPSFQIWTR